MRGNFGFWNPTLQIALLPEALPQTQKAPQGETQGSRQWGLSPRGRGNLSANVGGAQAGFDPLALHPGKLPTGSIAVHGREGFCEAGSKLRNPFFFDTGLPRQSQ